MVKRERLVYSEVYKKPGLSILKGKLPKMRHTTQGLQPFEVFLCDAGVVERGGVEYEYQTLRCYFKRLRP